MDENVFEEIKLPQIKAGRQVLDIITSGMYNNSLMVLREYIQNAVDSLDIAVQTEKLRQDEGRIDIQLSPIDRSIVMYDNGVGLSGERVIEILCGIGISTKTNHANRGFRGIGRLGGIGYCDKLIFETRSSVSEPVSVLVWNAKRLRRDIRTRSDSIELASAVHNVVTFQKRSANKQEGPHFFKVTMLNIRKFYKDELMNLSAVYAYLSKVAPLSFNSNSFAWKEKIDNHLSPIDGYRSYNISLNGEILKKLHKNEIAYNTNIKDVVRGVELFTFQGRNGDIIAKGWYADTHCLASLPKSVEMRGIRIRQGNIEIGDEYFLSEFYTERRFSTWHIGEIQCNYMLKSNARRDGFEETTDLESFYEQIHLLCRHLSHRCRSSSITRSKETNISRLLSKVESLIKQPFFLSADHLSSAICETDTILLQLEQMITGSADLSGYMKQIKNKRKEVDYIKQNSLLLSSVLDGRSLRHIEHKELIGSIAQGILEQHHKHLSAESLIKAILDPYLKPNNRM